MAGTLKWNRRLAVAVVILAVVVPYGLLILRFSLRNDQLGYFLPVRMYMRDAFLHHEFMLWNPFMSGSYPIHCDMQAAIWNPSVILLTSLFNYNASLLSIELLLYYVIGAIGCFYFALNFSRNLYSCIIIAVIYGCGGFATSIMEFMSWVGSFAYLPWVVHFFYLLLKRRDIYSAICLSISLWLMLVSGYPSFLIYLAYCLLAAVAVYCWRLYVQKKGKEIARIIGFGLLSGVLFVLLALPAIHSFYEYLPYYSRGVRTTDAHIAGEYFSWNYPMSLLFPAAGNMVWDNDLYIGLAPLLILVCGLGKKRVLRFRDKFLLPGFLFTLLFTMGRSTPVRIWSAKHLPFMDAFGFSHSVGIFLMLGVFVWLAPRLDEVFSGQGDLRRRLRPVQYAAWLAALVLVLYFIAGYHRITFKTGTVRFFYCVSFAWQLVLLGVLGCSVLVFSSAKRLFFFVLADLVGAVFTVAPATGFTVTSPGVYNRNVAAFYHSDAGALLDPVAKMKMIHAFNPHAEVNAMKVVGRNIFPSHTQSEAFYNYVSDSDRYKKLFSMPFVFASDSTALQVRDLRLGYNFIDADVRAERGCRMVIQQAFYPRWKSEDPAYMPSSHEGLFLEVPLRKGENRVRLFYDGRDLEMEAIVSFLTLLGLGGILFRRYRRGRVARRRSGEKGGDGDLGAVQRLKIGELEGGGK